MSGAETTSARETHRRKRKRGTAEETAEYNAKSIKHDRSEVVREESKSTFLVVFWKVSASQLIFSYLFPRTSWRLAKVK